MKMGMVKTVNGGVWVQIPSMDIDLTMASAALNRASQKNSILEVVNLEKLRKVKTFKKRVKKA